LGNDSKEDQLTKTITETIKERKPQTVKELTRLVKERLPTEEQKKILDHILKLQNEGKIKLTKQPTAVPTEFSLYLVTEQALWYWITIATAVVTAATVFAIPEDFYPWVYIRYVLGTIFVLWLPGYTFIKTLFPAELPIKLSIKTSNENLDTIERIALSIGMSLALVPIAGLLLNYTPWGIRQTPIVLSLLTLTVIFATAGILREHQAKAA
jgi:hypothetical protein